MLQTRAQRAMVNAWQDIAKVDAMSDDIKKIYGGLCHQFPVLVRTCGLCQALAFSADKGSKDTDRGRAHGMLLQHVQGILTGHGLTGPDGNVLDVMRIMDMPTYVHATQVLLDHWIFYKRFAVSVLGIESAQAAEGEEG